MDAKFSESGAIIDPIDQCLQELENWYMTFNILGIEFHGISDDGRCYSKIEIPDSKMKHYRNEIFEIRHLERKLKISNRIYKYKSQTTDTVAVPPNDWKRR